MEFLSNTIQKPPTPPAGKSAVRRCSFSFNQRATPPFGHMLIIKKSIMNILGKEFVAAINAILKEKNKKTISFDPIYFDGHPKKNELPWCNTFDCMIVTIGSPQMVIGKDSLENTKEFSYYERMIDNKDVKTAYDKKQIKKMLDEIYK